MLFYTKNCVLLFHNNYTFFTSQKTLQKRDNDVSNRREKVNKKKGRKSENKKLHLYMGGNKAMESRVDKDMYKTIRVTVNGKPVGKALVVDEVTYAPIHKNEGIAIAKH